MWFILRMWSVIAVTRKGIMQITVQKPSPRTSKGLSKVRKIEEPVADKAVEEPKSIRQIRIRFSDLTADPFIKYRIKVYGYRISEEASESEEKDMRSWIRAQTSIRCLEDNSLYSWMTILI